MANSSSKHYQFILGMAVLLLVGFLLSPFAENLENKTIQKESAGSGLRSPDLARILDCSFKSQKQFGGCNVRVPLGHKLLDVSGVSKNAISQSLFMAYPGRLTFPENFSFSATLFLIDLTPGARAGRRPTFEREKALLSNLVRNFPKQEMIAVYGFNHEIVQLIDFSKDRDAVVKTVDDLFLGGYNSLIERSALDAVEVLKNTNNSIFKNLIIVSDGLEESGTDFTHLINEANKNNIVISTIGAFWEPLGSARNGFGMHYLASIANETSGVFASLSLRNYGDARKALSTFEAEIEQSIAQSGFILFQDRTEPSTVTITLQRPVIGVPETFEDYEVSSAFVPLQ